MSSTKLKQRPMVRTSVVVLDGSLGVTIGEVGGSLGLGLLRHGRDCRLCIGLEEDWAGLGCVSDSKGGRGEHKLNQCGSLLRLERYVRRAKANIEET